MRINLIKIKGIYFKKLILFQISYIILFINILQIFVSKYGQRSYSFAYALLSINQDYSIEGMTDLKSQEFNDILIQVTCGHNGEDFSKFGKQFVKKKLKIFSINEFNRLNYMNKLPIIYKGENKDLMLRAFKKGEILGAPLRLRNRIKKDSEVIQIIEDDFMILGDNLDSEKQMNMVYFRAMNEIRYTVLLCGGELISFLPILHYMRELSDSGMELGNDPIISLGISIYEKEKAAYRRKRAEIETKYLSNLPYSNEIYIGEKINSGGLIIGIPDSIEEEKNFRALENEYLENENEEMENIIIGMNIRAKENYFKKNQENMLRNKYYSNLYNSIFEFNSPQALFTSYNGESKDIFDNNFFFNRKNAIPYQITKADSISSTTLNRIKSDISNSKDFTGNNEYSVEGSIEFESKSSHIPEKEGKLELSFSKDPYDSDNIIVGRKLRPNDQIHTGSIEQTGIIISESNIKTSDLEPIKGFELNENLSENIIKIMSDLQQNDFKKLENINTSSKEFREAFMRFPAYLSQTKIISNNHQAYIFWKSIMYSSELMEKRYKTKIANFPIEVPSFKMLEKKIPRTRNEIRRACYRIIRSFQKKGTPFIFKNIEEIDNKNYRINYFDPFNFHYTQKYREYVKLLCNDILPDIFIFTIQYVFDKIISIRENKFLSNLEERKQELDIQEKELDMKRKITESVTERVNITPYLVEEPFKRYMNAWRRSIGYSGIVVYPSIKISMFEKIYNIIKFGPDVINKKKKDASTDEVRNYVSKAVVKLIDEYFASLNPADFFLNIHEIENFIQKIFSHIFAISMEDLIKNMPIKPEINIRNVGYNLSSEDIHDSCVEYVKPIIKVNKNINLISENELLIQNPVNSNSILEVNNQKKKVTSELSLIEKKYKIVCSAISRLLNVNISKYSLSFEKSDGLFSKQNKDIKNIFIHQTLTDGISSIPIELGIKMFETTYLDIFERVCEQHGILKFISTKLNNGKMLPMFEQISKIKQIELTSETINYSQIENIFRLVYEDIAKKTNNYRIEFFNENIMGKYILENLGQLDLSVPNEIKTLPPFLMNHKYPWTTDFLISLKKWCSSMIYSLAEESLIKNIKDNYVYKKDTVDSIVEKVCKDEILLGIRNNIEYEADEILRKNFAYHLGVAFVYWHYKRPIPKWIFFDQWQTRYDAEQKINLSEEPEISLVTFIILKCIADMEYPLPAKGINIQEMQRLLLNIKNNPNINTNEARFAIWNNTPLKSISSKDIGLSYFLFPNIVDRSIISKLSSDDTLAFTGPHEIFWVGADEREFHLMCMNSIQKLYNYIFSKKSSELNLNIWITENENARDLICRDIAGRFFYPKTVLNCDQALSEEGRLLIQNFELERSKLRRSQWLAIQEILRRKSLNRNKREQNDIQESEMLTFVHGLSYSSFVVDFRESDELTETGSFVKNCVAAFETAMLFPEGSPYKLKTTNKVTQTISNICEEAMKLYYTSSIPMNWDEQQTLFNPISTENYYFISRVAVAQHNVILEQINEQNELGEHGITSSDRFSSHSSSSLIINVSDKSSEFIQNCIKYIWEAIQKKLIYLENGYDMSNSDTLIEKTCKKSSYRYFMSEMPLTYEEMIDLVNKDEISEWHRARYKMGQWRALVDVFDSIAKQYSGGYMSAISQTFKLPKYMQLADFNTSNKLLTIEEDCMKSISYLIKIHSCSSNFVVIFGRVNNFCNYVSQVYKNTKI